MIWLSPWTRPWAGERKRDGRAGEAGTLLAKASYAKSSKAQLFHLVPEVADGLRTLRASLKVRSIDGADPVFRTKTGRPWSKGWLCALMRKAVANCPGIPAGKRSQVTFHTLRHSFASLLAMAGLSTRKIQEALAHSDPKLTGRYAHLGSEVMLEVQQSIGQILGPPSDTVRVREGYRGGYQAPAQGRSA